ncbi:glycosyltransferase family 2 protein [Tannockella kyphosi]|uniref:glycosyltransferase family 2 protein n=1 Tax=Tannockella kyphosi TaxID=2899121 RepID=UPI002012F0BC|nr:glycosyltransferase family 2 protein [Tannockella kyphosi]
MDNLVSVVIPVYNREKYIERCVNSIQQQTYRNIEIIIVNDGSTDSSLSICKQLQENDNRIKLYSQENKGVSFARNVGIRNSTGTYLLFVDSDDYIEKETIEVAIPRMRDDADMVMFGIKVINKLGHTHPHGQTEGPLTVGTMMEDYFLAINGILHNSPCNKVYQKQILEKHKILFDENVKNGEDVLFNFEYYQYIKNILYIDNYFYYYYSHKNQSSDTYNEDHLNSVLYRFNKEKILYKNIMKKEVDIIKSNQMFLSYIKRTCFNNHLSPYEYKKKLQFLKEYINNSEVQGLLSTYKPDKLVNYIYYVFFKSNSATLVYWLTKLHRNVNIIRKSY